MSSPIPLIEVWAVATSPEFSLSLTLETCIVLIELFNSPFIILVALGVEEAFSPIPDYDSIFIPMNGTIFAVTIFIQLFLLFIFIHWCVDVEVLQVYSHESVFALILTLIAFLCCS